MNSCTKTALGIVKESKQHYNEWRVDGYFTCVGLDRIFL
jgi:hypothetical protein